MVHESQRTIYVQRRDESFLIKHIYYILYTISGIISGMIFDQIWMCGYRVRYVCILDQISVWTQFLIHERVLNYLYGAFK